MEFIRDENKMTDNQITLQIEISLIIDRLQNGLIHPMTAKAKLYEASQKQGQTLPSDSLIKCYTEKDIDNAYDKGFNDGNQRDRTGSLIEVL
jgi:hypothetical protein